MWWNILSGNNSSEHINRITMKKYTIFSLALLFTWGMALTSCGKKKKHYETDVVAEQAANSPLPTWPDTTRFKGCIRVKMVTSMGDMVLALYNQTPKHRDNFLKLVKNDFYQNLLFHRVIQGFMIQGGDPDSRNAPAGMMLGQGGQKDASGKEVRIDAEFIDTLYHLKGALAAARQSEQVNPLKQSSGSQFYIVSGKPSNREELEAMRQNIAQERFFADPANDAYRVRRDMYQQSGDQAGWSRMMSDIDPQIRQFRATKNLNYPEWVQRLYESTGGAPMLDGQYTVFGQLISGFDVLDKIAAAPTATGDRPQQDIKIIRCSILE